MKASEMIEWQESRGGSMGQHRNLVIDKKYVGHFYEDASIGINVRQVLENIEIRYNSFDVLVDALRAAREDADEVLLAKVDAALLSRYRSTTWRWNK